MTKLYEVKTPQEWTNLATLVEHTVSGVIELFNAGREGGVDIMWTESTNAPESSAFYRLLKRQKSVVFTIGTQPIWVKSEIQGAKLMISTPNTSTVTLEGKI